MEYKEGFNEITDTEELLDNNSEVSVEYEPQFGDIAPAFDESAEADVPTSLPKKKKFPLQVPIIIAICILVGALVGYFAISLFVPTVEGTWLYESDDGYSFYYTIDENSDGKECVLNVGTIYFPGTYETSISDEANTISFSMYAGYINGNYAYTLEGNRLFGDRVLTLTSEDGTAITLKQTKKTKDSDFITPDENFEPVESIVGEWEFVYEEFDASYKLTINDDGTLVYDQFGLQEIHCVYTADEKAVSLSFFETELITQEEEYYFDGDQLIFLGINWTKAGTSTADEA